MVAVDPSTLNRHENSRPLVTTEGRNSRFGDSTAVHIPDVQA